MRCASLGPTPGNDCRSSTLAWFKSTGKRIFRMAPLHHHYELKGWAEPKIIVRFWIVSIMSGLVALLSLKLR